MGMGGVSDNLVSSNPRSMIVVVVVVVVVVLPGAPREISIYFEF